MMTKDEWSDLQSLIDRLIQVKLEFQLADLRVKEALSALESFQWKLENKKA